MTATGKPTSYFQVQREREAALEMDALTDGHAALMLQSQRLANRGPQYPQQPVGSPWSCDPVPPEGPLGRAIDQVVDMTKVEQR